MSNSWWEISILSAPSLEELIFARLEKFGCWGMATEFKGQSCIVRTYLPQEAAQILDLAALAIWIKEDALALNLPLPMTQWHLIEEEDWSSSWKKHWQPEEVGDCLLIYPAWLNPPTDSERLILRLDPGVAFGTGQHPTTQMCLESLEMRLEDNTDSNLVLADIGCGSGILAIGAILLGAKQVYALDVDPLAVEAASSNRMLNQIKEEQLVIAQGSVELIPKMTNKKIDGIVCNILAEVIVDLIPQITEIVKTSSWGILSGILVEQAKVVTDNLEKNGWTVATLWQRQEWCCLNIRKI